MVPHAWVCTLLHLLVIITKSMKWVFKSRACLILGHPQIVQFASPKETWNAYRNKNQTKAK
jgi:hypothetical protein